MEKKDERICLVTAFIDIGRYRWKTYGRSNKKYLDAFLPYFQLTEEIIIFLDHSCTEMKNAIDEIIISKTYRNKKVTLILLVESKACITANLTNIVFSENKVFLQSIHYSDIPAWKYIEKERKIMNSNYYKSLISHRINHPELCIPVYNVIMHCKFD